MVQYFMLVLLPSGDAFYNTFFPPDVVVEYKMVFEWRVKVIATIDDVRGNALYSNTWSCILEPCVILCHYYFMLVK